MPHANESHRRLVNHTKCAEFYMYQELEFFEGRGLQAPVKRQGLHDHVAWIVDLD